MRRLGRHLLPSRLEKQRSMSELDDKALTLRPATPEDRFRIRRWLARVWTSAVMPSNT
jgi:hypothetical protein